MKNIMRYKWLFFWVFLAFHTEGVCQEIPIPSDYDDPDSTIVGNNEDVEDDLYEKRELQRQWEYQKARNEYASEKIEERNFDKNSWENAKNGLDYTIKPKEKKPEKENEDMQVEGSGFKHSPISGAWVGILKWFFIIVAVFLIAFLVLKFVNEGNIFGRQSRRVFAPSVTIDLENIEDNLQDADLDPYIKKAIDQKQFSLAIRLYYLAILKELNERNVIKWKKDKTNSAYVREMRQHALSESFRNITSIFERVWYGSSVIDESTFLMIQPAFQDVLKNAKKS